MTNLRDLLRARSGYETWEYGQQVYGPDFEAVVNVVTDPVQITGIVPVTAFTLDNPLLRIEGNGAGSSIETDYTVWRRFADIGGLGLIKANIPLSLFNGTPSVRIGTELTGTGVIHDIGLCDCLFQLGEQPNWYSGTPVKPVALRFERSGWKYPIVGLCDNLTVDGMTGSSRGLYIAQTHFNVGGDNVVVKNCDITINNEAGIKGTGRNRRFIDNNVVFNGEECFGIDASHGTFVRVTGKTSDAVIVEWVSQHPILFHALPQDLSVSRKGSTLGFVTGNAKNQVTMVTAHTAGSTALVVDTTMFDIADVSVGDICSLNYGSIIDQEISGNTVTLVNERWDVGEGFNGAVSIFGTAFRTRIENNDIYHGATTHDYSVGVHVASVTHTPSSYGMGAYCIADTTIANNRFHNVKHPIGVENIASGVYLGLLADPVYQSKPFFRRSYMDNGSDDWPGGTLERFDSGIVPVGTPSGVRNLTIVGNEQTGGNRSRLLDVFDVHWDNPLMKKPETSYDDLHYPTPPNYPLPDDPDYETLTWDTWYKTIHWMETGDDSTPLGALPNWDFLKGDLTGASGTTFTAESVGVFPTLTATATTNGISVTYDGATPYTLERATAPYTSWTTVATPSTATFLDPIVDGGTYKYRVGSVESAEVVAMDIELFDFVLSVPTVGGASHGYTVSLGTARGVQSAPAASHGLTVSIGRGDGTGTSVTLFDFTLLAPVTLEPRSHGRSVSYGTARGVQVQRAESHGFTVSVGFARIFARLRYRPMARVTSKRPVATVRRKVR